MRDDHLVVGGDADIELQRRHAELERPREGGQRVLRQQAARAAMALHVEGARARRLQREGGEHQHAEGEAAHEESPVCLVASRLGYHRAPRCASGQGAPIRVCARKREKVARETG
jgi:hypothetical protein